MNKMKFRKKPVVIEAFQMTEERRINNTDWPEWMHRAWSFERGLPGSLYPTEEGTCDGTLSIGTLEGQHLVSWGDWLIKGVKGELYPCKPDIFEQTYEPVSETNISETDRQRRCEPVAWHTEDHLTDKSATTYDPVVAKRWIEKGWPVTPLFYSPQPAAPKFGEDE